MAIVRQAVQTDAELVRAARDGDKDAFGALVDRHQSMVVALVQRLLTNPAIAADAAQEAAVTALVALPRLRSPERFGAWYAGIALNTARRWLRGAPATTSLPSEWPDGVAPSPEELAVAAQVAERVRDAVRNLPRGQREAVLAFYWQGLSHTEAAAELAVSPGAVKARLHQARASMEPLLAGYVEGERKVVVAETGESAWVDVEVSEVGRSDGDDPSSRVHVVVLKEHSGERVLPIFVGAPEELALACSLESVETPRPMTCQFATDLARTVGSTVAEVRVTKLSESMFYAVVVLQGQEGSPKLTRARAMP